jgi:hypothetical protein
MAGVIVRELVKTVLAPQWGTLPEASQVQRLERKDSGSMARDTLDVVANPPPPDAMGKTPAPTPETIAKLEQWLADRKVVAIRFGASGSVAVVGHRWISD